MCALPVGQSKQFVVVVVVCAFVRLCVWVEHSESSLSISQAQLSIWPRRFLGSAKSAEYGQLFDFGQASGLSSAFNVNYLVGIAVMTRRLRSDCNSVGHSHERLDWPEVGRGA